MNSAIDHPQIKIDAPVLLGIVILVTFGLQWLLPLSFFPSFPGRIIGGILFVGGFFLGFPALRGMRKASTSPNPHHPTRTLISEGTYRITRNPMYLGMLISYSGLFIFFQNPWFLLFLPILIWSFTTWVIIPEEKYLEGKFGKDYLNFKARVRRWI